MKEFLGSSLARKKSSTGTDTQDINKTVPKNLSNEYLASTQTQIKLESVQIKSEYPVSENINPNEITTMEDFDLSDVFASNSEQYSNQQPVVVKTEAITVKREKFPEIIEILSSDSDEQSPAVSLAQTTSSGAPGLDSTSFDVPGVKSTPSCNVPDTDSTNSSVTPVTLDPDSLIGLLKTKHSVNKLPPKSITKADYTIINLSDDEGSKTENETQTRISAKANGNSNQRTNETSSNKFKIGSRGGSGNHQISSHVETAAMESRANPQPRQNIQATNSHATQNQSITVITPKHPQPRQKIQTTNSDAPQNQSITPKHPQPSQNIQTTNSDAPQNQSITPKHPQPSQNIQTTNSDAPQNQSITPKQQITPRSTQPKIGPARVVSNTQPTATSDSIFASIAQNIELISSRHVKCLEGENVMVKSAKSASHQTSSEVTEKPLTTLGEEIAHLASQMHLIKPSQVIVTINQAPSTQINQPSEKIPEYSKGIPSVRGSKIRRRRGTTPERERLLSNKDPISDDSKHGDTSRSPKRSRFSDKRSNHTSSKHRTSRTPEKEHRKSNNNRGYDSLKVEHTSNSTEKERLGAKHRDQESHLVENRPGHDRSKRDRTPERTTCLSDKLPDSDGPKHNRTSHGPQREHSEVQRRSEDQSSASDQRETRRYNIPGDYQSIEREQRQRRRDSTFQNIYQEIPPHEKNRENRIYKSPSDTESQVKTDTREIYNSPEASSSFRRDTERGVVWNPYSAQNEPIYSRDIYKSDENCSTSSASSDGDEENDTDITVLNTKYDLQAAAENYSVPGFDILNSEDDLETTECSVCGKWNESWDTHSLGRHLKNKHGMTHAFYRCVVCGFDVAKSSKIKKHLSYRHNVSINSELVEFLLVTVPAFRGTIPKCKNCEYQSHSLTLRMKHNCAKPENLNQFRMMHKLEEIARVKTLERITELIEASDIPGFMDAHGKLITENAKSVGCTFCPGKMYACYYDYNNHLKSAHDMYCVIYRCFLCGHEEITMKDLATHLRINHNISIKRNLVQKLAVAVEAFGVDHTFVQCPDCELLCVRNKSMKLHICGRNTKTIDEVLGHSRKQNRHVETKGKGKNVQRKSYSGGYTGYIESGKAEYAESISQSHGFLFHPESIGSPSSATLGRPAVSHPTSTEQALSAKKERFAERVSQRSEESKTFANNGRDSLSVHSINAQSEAQSVVKAKSKVSRDDITVLIKSSQFQEYFDTTFAYRYELETSERMKAKPSQTCPICKNRFSPKDVLQHCRRIHGLYMTVYRCYICGQDTYPFSQDMERHMENHTVKIEESAIAILKTVVPPYEKIPVCEQCNFQTASDEIMFKHQCRSSR